MAQDGTTAGGASYTLDNVTFPVGRSKLQSIFDAIRSTNKGNTAPDLVAGQFWLDDNTPSTTVWTLYFYDGSDSIQFATIDTINNTVNFIDSTFDLINDTTPELGGNLSTNGNDINFGDNDKAQFGDSNDLQIYHDSGNSVIADKGTGHLLLTAPSFRLRNDAQNEEMITADENGAVKIYYDGSQKLATTSTGIDVTGTLVSDALTVETGSSSGQIALFKGDTNFFRITADGNNSIISTSGNGGAQSGLTFQTDPFTSEVTRMNISAIGDISFYEDTGTTPKLFWDASAESLGIGTSSPVGRLNVNSTTINSPVFRIDYAGTNSSSGNILVPINTAQNTTSGGAVTATAVKIVDTSTGGSLPATKTLNAFHIDISSSTYGIKNAAIFEGGNVGIGTSSPDKLLHLAAGQGATLRFESTTTGATTGDIFGAIEFETQDSSSAGVKAKIDAYSEGGVGNASLRFFTGDTVSLDEAMRIDSSGNVGIGTSSPSSKLDVTGEIRTNDDIRFTSGARHKFVGGGSGNNLELGTYSSSNTVRNIGLVIDSGGNVGIGATSITTLGSNHTTLQINGTSIDKTGALRLRSSNDSVDSALWASTTSTYLATISNHPLQFRTNNTERMRITDGGNVLVGTTSTTGIPTGNSTNDGGYFSSSGALLVQQNSDSNIYLSKASGYSYNGFVRFFVTGIERGTITTNGSSVSYNTTSDYRLKENVVDLTSATERLKQLSPKRFNFIADADTTVDGFLAHEVQSVVPEAINGEKDGVDNDGNPKYQGIDQSKLVPLLVATIKELEARITALET